MSTVIGPNVFADAIALLDSQPRPETVGEIRARACDDGSCPGVARVGLVAVSCTHPEHARRERVRHLEWKRARDEVAAVFDVPLSILGC